MFSDGNRKVESKNNSQLFPLLHETKKIIESMKNNEEKRMKAVTRIGAKKA